MTFSSDGTDGFREENDPVIVNTEGNVSFTSCHRPSLSISSLVSKDENEDGLAEKIPKF